MLFKLKEMVGLTKRMVLLYSIFIIPLIIRAQETGIQFSSGLSWSQIREKARIENKLIFLDCFATWCAPCREMDRTVYPVGRVGHFMNARFISVKVQLDTTRNDDDPVQQWYEDAYSIQQQFKISVLPTFLFLSPEGKILHKGVGKKNVEEFLDIACDATDPAKQYYTLINNYRQGIRNYEGMGFLSIKAKELGDVNLADSIAVDFKDNYLNKKEGPGLCTRENIEFIRQFYRLLTSQDSLFSLFYHHADFADRIVASEGLSERLVRYVVGKEIDSMLWLAGRPIKKDPDWAGIESTIRRRYDNELSARLVLDAGISFYKKIGDWNSYAKLREKKIRLYPPKPGGGLTGDAWGLNGDAWDVFLHGSNTDVLNQALHWIDISIVLNDLDEPDLNLQVFDTKANLLYKLGRVNEAIVWEEKAIRLGISRANKNGRDKGIFFDEYNETLNKMRNGQPTWPLDMAKKNP